MRIIVSYESSVGPSHQTLDLDLSTQRELVAARLMSGVRGMERAFDAIRTDPCFDDLPTFRQIALAGELLRPRNRGRGAASVIREFLEG